jgi:hypothetical protein
MAQQSASQVEVGEAGCLWRELLQDEVHEVRALPHLATRLRLAACNTAAPLGSGGALQTSHAVHDLIRDGEGFTWSGTP